MSGDPPGRLDPAQVASLYRAHQDELRRFLMGVLRDAALVTDVMQTAFVRLMEQGHTTHPDKRKAWLFRVAYHEALAIRRRQQTGKRVRVEASRHRTAAAPAAEEAVLRKETVLEVRQAIAELPDAQREVVERRIYRGQKFAEIAEELGIPLGTALGRMRQAVVKIRRSLESSTQDTTPPSDSEERTS